MTGTGTMTRTRQAGRPSKGAQLYLRSPKRPGGGQRRWVILDTVNGRRIEQSTGAFVGDHREAERAFATYLAEKHGPGDQGPVRDTLAHYGQQIASAIARGTERAQPETPIADPAEVGVYLLMLKGKVVYVGSSLRMPRRVAGHRTNGRPFDQAYYIATTAGQRTQLEATLIRAINPPQNKVHRTGTNGHALDHDTGHADA
jgi:hypothetical protein